MAAPTIFSSYAAVQPIPNREDNMAYILHTGVLI